MNGVHLGENIARLREIKGIKQETFAEMMGVSQAAISKLEATANIDDERLKEVAEKLGVSVRAIKRFDADNIIQYIENMNDNAQAIARIDVYNIHPVDKISELYERMLKEKNAEIERLKKEKK